MIIFISVVIPQLDFNIFKLKCQQLKLNFLKFFVDLSNRTVYNMDIRTKQKGSENMKTKEEKKLAAVKNIITATRLRAAMERINITAKELSVKSGVSEPSISQYIHGTFAPRNITAGKLADALDVDPMWLMGFDVEMLQQKTRIEHFDYFVEGATDIAGVIPEYDERGHKIQELFSHMKVLNTDGIEKLIDRAKELEEVPKYKMNIDEKKQNEKRSSEKFHSKETSIIVNKDDKRYKEFISKLKHFRELNGLSQNELAQKVGYSNRSAIARIENGEIDLPYSKILAFAKVLNVTPGQLMDIKEKDG